MGYDAVVIADSTSRWAEALREFASRSGALPAEEGYPASLPSALAAFYERAGRVTTLGGRPASVTIIGAVSPPGGDTTEPVTAHTQRFVRGVWSLDRELAYARHYPAVAWAGRSPATPRAWGSGTRATETPMGPATGPGDQLLARQTASATSLPWSGPAPYPARAGGSPRRAAAARGCSAAECLVCQRRPLHGAKTAALIDAALSVVDACEEAIRRGVIASEIEELDFAPLLLRPRAGRRTRRPRTALRVSSPAGADAGPRQGTAVTSPSSRGGLAALAVEYSDVEEIRGPLLVVRGVSGVGWDESAVLRIAGEGSGERHGVVLEVDHDLAVVQVLEGTERLVPRDTSVVFSGEPARVPVGPGWLGRVCNGRGDPVDGGPPVTAATTAPVSGSPLNPTHRARPTDPVLTGISAIDALTTLVGGQKLPIFSGGRLPHLELAVRSRPSPAPVPTRSASSSPGWVSPTRTQTPSATSSKSASPPGSSSCCSTPPTTP